MIGDFRLFSPSHTFLSDILNHSYFDKRNLYLGYLYHFLSQQSDIIRGLSLGFLKSDNRKPVVVIQPNLRTDFVVRIFLTV